MNYVLKYSLLKLSINHRCHTTPTRTAVVSALPWLVPLGLALGSMSHRTARPQVPLPPAQTPHPRQVVRRPSPLTVQASSALAKKRSLLSFLNVYCLRWRPSVLHAAFCGHVKGNRLSPWRWRFALGEELVCKRAVKEGRMKDCQWSFERTPLEEH